MIESVSERCRNWSKWGDDDEAGTLNYLSAELVVAAAGLIRSGRVFSLALPFGGSGPQKGHLRRFNAMHFMMRDGCDVAAGDFAGLPRGFGGADDAVVLATHGSTHWDALAHIFWDSKMWNNRDATLVTSQGAQKNGITSFKDKVVGRAVLLDIARVKRVDWLNPGYEITASDLDDACTTQRVTPSTGDILLVRTGQIAMCRARDDWGEYAAGGPAPGLGFETLDWIHDHRLAAVASDTWGVEVMPYPKGFITAPWHRVAIPSMGLAVGEMFDLDELAADCAADGIYESFMVATPLPIEGGVGGPVNPIAIK